MRAGGGHGSASLTSTVFPPICVPLSAFIAFSASYLSSKVTKPKVWPSGQKTSATAPNFPKASLRASLSVHPSTRHGLRCTGLRENAAIEDVVSHVSSGRGTGRRVGLPRRARPTSSSPCRKRGEERFCEIAGGVVAPRRLPLRLPGVHRLSFFPILLSLERLGPSAFCVTFLLSSVSVFFAEILMAGGCDQVILRPCLVAGADLDRCKGAEGGGGRPKRWAG